VGGTCGGRKRAVEGTSGALHWQGSAREGLQRPRTSTLLEARHDNTMQALFASS
jgi:hypothetical protein